MTVGYMRRDAYDVLFYLPTLSPARGAGAEATIGGAETQVVLRARALAQRGVRACIMVPAFGGPLPAHLSDINVVVRTESRARQRFVGKIREFSRIVRALARVDVPVIVADCAGPSIGLVAVATRLLRRRFIYSTASYRDFEFAERGLRPRDLALYRLGLQLANVIVVQTREQADSCRKSLDRDSVVIRSVAHVAEVSTIEPTEFLWIGRVVPIKRPLAYVELAHALPGYRFSMVAVPKRGQESLMDHVRRSAADVPNLELHGPLSRAGVLERIRRAIAVVSTSEVEGMPNVFLEAWGHGVPVLALAHDPDGIIEGERLGACAHDSLEALIADARKLAESRGERARIAERCRRVVDLVFSEEVVATSWMRVIAPGVEGKVDPTAREGS